MSSFESGISNGNYGDKMDHNNQKNMDVVKGIFTCLSQDANLGMKFTSFMQRATIYQNDRIFTVVFLGQNPLMVSLSKKGAFSYIYADTRPDEDCAEEIETFEEATQDPSLDRSKGWKRRQRLMGSIEEA